MTPQDHIKYAKELSAKAEKLQAKIDLLEEEIRTIDTVRMFHTDQAIASRKRGRKPDSEATIFDLPSTEKLTKSKLTIFGCIQQFFAESHNEWATVESITIATGKVRESVRQVLYKTHAAEFDRQSNDGFGGVTHFRMKEEGEQK